MPHPPSDKAILGTMPGQIDVFHSLVWGARNSLQFGVLVAGSALFLGVVFGAASGYAGGRVNDLMMRVTDGFLTFPVLAAVFFIKEIIGVAIESMGGAYYINPGTFGRSVYFFEPPSATATLLLKVDPILISLILFSWMPIARIVNTLVITLKNTDYIQAARALGGGPAWVLRRHLIPNSIAPALVLATRDVGSTVVLQATITFIGLGGNSPWGVLLALGRNFVIGPGANLLYNWWLYLPATLAVILFGLGWNLLGDGLRDALDPQLQH
jgi:peptide/nickel transport system permease protein